MLKFKRIGPLINQSKLPIQKDMCRHQWYTMAIKCKFSVIRGKSCDQTTFKYSKALLDWKLPKCTLLLDVGRAFSWCWKKYKFSTIPKNSTWEEQLTETFAMNFLDKLALCLQLSKQWILKKSKKQQLRLLWQLLIKYNQSKVPWKSTDVNHSYDQISLCVWTLLRRTVLWNFGDELI